MTDPMSSSQRLLQALLRAQGHDVSVTAGHPRLVAAGSRPRRKGRARDRSHMPPQPSSPQLSPRTSAHSRRLEADLAAPYGGPGLTVGLHTSMAAPLQRVSPGVHGPTHTPSVHVICGARAAAPHPSSPHMAASPPAGTCRSTAAYLVVLTAPALTAAAVVAAIFCPRTPVTDDALTAHLALRIRRRCLRSRRRRREPHQLGVHAPSNTECLQRIR